MNDPASSRLDKESLRLLQEALERLDEGFASLPPIGLSQPGIEAMEPVLQEVAERLKDNYPYFHPLYAGQMLKPPHPVARLAYMLAMWINPNNHALDGGRASSAMEKEAVADLARMVGWETHLGHLTGGGTMANLEALWIAGRLRPGMKVVASQQAHYTHSRISGVLGLDFESIPCDRTGRMDVAALARRLEQGDVGTVVATIGTTATGSVDPLAGPARTPRPPRLPPARRRGLWRLLRPGRQPVSPDPPGLRPPGRGGLPRHRSAQARPAALRLRVRPFPRPDGGPVLQARLALHLLHLQRAAPGRDQPGVLAPRCSGGGPVGHAAAPAAGQGRRVRPDAGQRPSGGAGPVRSPARRPRFVTAFPPELDIVVWAIRARRVSEASRLARRIFDEAARRDLHLALANLPVEFFDLKACSMEQDADTITCLRSVLMKPEHKDWLDRIWEILSESADAVMGPILIPRTCGRYSGKVMANSEDSVLAMTPTSSIGIKWSVVSFFSELTAES